MVKTELHIPFDVLVNPRLDAANKIIVAKVLSLSDAPLGVIISDQTLSEITGMKRAGVNKRITHLVNEGVLAVRKLPRAGRHSLREIKFLELPQVSSVKVEAGVVPRRNSGKKRKSGNEMIAEIIQKSKEESGVSEGNTTSFYYNLYNNNIDSSTSSSVENVSCSHENFMCNANVPNLEEDHPSVKSTGIKELQKEGANGHHTRGNTSSSNRYAGGMSLYQYHEMKLREILDQIISKSSLGSRVEFFVLEGHFDPLDRLMSEDERQVIWPLVADYWTVKDQFQ